MKGRTEDELIDWLWLVCQNLKNADEFLKAEGYTKREESEDDDDSEDHS